MQPKDWNEAANAGVSALETADTAWTQQSEEHVSNLEAELSQLSTFSPAEYAQKREALAANLGIARPFLDQEYKERRRGSKTSEIADELSDVEPWPKRVDGARLLHELRDMIAAHVVLPQGAAEAIALWAVFSHAHDCFQISPILAVSSPTPECGKTTLLTVLGRVVRRPLPASNITASAVFRGVEKWQPTLLIDEADTFLRDSDELRGCLNSGHQRSNAYFIRTTGENYEPTRFCTWAPKAIALIGKMPATLASRAIHVELRRKTKREKVRALRFDRTEHLAHFPRQAARWAADNEAEIRSAEPAMPLSVTGRAADNWRPLLAIADVAGNDWPQKAREIAEVLRAGQSESTAHIMVLEDIQKVFSHRGETNITTSVLIDALVAMDDRPWPEWKGKPITPRQLARLLEAFEIAPKQLWTSGVNHRGYELSQFTDAFSRYLGDLSASPLEPNECAIFCTSDPLEADVVLADRNAKKAPISNGSSALADKYPPSDHWGDDIAISSPEREFPELPSFLDRRVS